MIVRRAVLAAGFAIPASSLAAEGAPRFPFRVTRNRPWTLVKFKDRGGHLLFMLDTGSSMFAILDDQAKALGLPLRDRLKGRTAGRRVDISYYRGRLVVGGVMHEDNADLLGLPGSLPQGLQGVVPATRFGAMGFDFDAQEVTITRRFEGGDGYQPLELDPGAGQLRSLDHLGAHSRSELFEWLRDNRPVVEAELDGKMLKCLVDTGSPFGLSLTPRYAKEHGLWDSHAAAPTQTIQGLVAPQTVRLVRAGGLRLGRVAFRDPIIALRDPSELNPGGGQVIDAVIGMEFLRRLNFVHDPQGRRLWIKPNRAVGDGYRYDRAGASEDVVDGVGRVTALRAGGPADRAGLRLDDKILGWRGQGGVDGLAWALMGAPGARIDIQVEREGRPSLISLTLEEAV